MDKAAFIPSIAKREENFYNGQDIANLSPEEIVSYSVLEQRANEVLSIIEALKDVYSACDILQLAFDCVYDFIALSQGESPFNPYYIFYNSHNSRRDRSLYDNLFQASFFVSLCLFLHDTKRLPGISYAQLTERNTPKSNEGKKPLKDEYYSSGENRLRQAAYRLKNRRKVYQKAPSGAALRNDSVHEWSLAFSINETRNSIKDTLKRIGNLNNEIAEALKTPQNAEQLEAAYNKYTRKLQKIEYKNYMMMCDYILDHLQEDQTHWGINLYRFEKELRLYQITNGMSKLIQCKTEQEKMDFCSRDFVIQDICFPKLYEDLFNMSDKSRAKQIAHNFWQFCNETVCGSRLIYDLLIDKNILGENWETQLLDTINELALEVLYDTDKLVCPWAPDAQDKFMSVISNPVCKTVLPILEVHDASAELKGKEQTGHDYQERVLTGNDNFFSRKNALIARLFPEINYNQTDI